MRRALSFLAIALAVAHPGEAQNLLVNPDFDVDLAGWSDPGVPWIASFFDTEDWADAPGSGSARVVNTIETTGNDGLSQCIEIPESDGETAIYDLTVQARVGDGDLLTGTAELGLWYDADTVCEGFNYGNNSLLWGLESWPAEGELGIHGIVIPAGTRSIRFELRANKYTPGGSFVAKFDHAYLPEPALGCEMALASLGALGLLRRRD